MTELAPRNRQNPESLPRVPVAVIFDFDDTLFDTSRAVEKLLLPKLAVRGISAEMLAEARAAAHRDNNRSLDVVDYVIQQCGQEVWDEIAAEYTEQGRRMDLLLPGAATAMESLHDVGIPFGIKTYGTPELQDLKRSAIQLPVDVPFRVINHRNKGAMIRETYDHTRGVFVIEWLGYVASRVALLENDPTAFAGLEEHMATGHVLGAWIPHSEADRQKPVPDGVREEKDITSAMATLGEWASQPLVK